VIDDGDEPRRRRRRRRRRSYVLVFFCFCLFSISPVFLDEAICFLFPFGILLLCVSCLCVQLKPLGGQLTGSTVRVLNFLHFALLPDRNRQRLNKKRDNKEMAACVARALLTKKCQKVKNTSNASNQINKTP
jgi:hypothetical protein